MVSKINLLFSFNIYTFTGAAFVFDFFVIADFMVFWFTCLLYIFCFIVLQKIVDEINHLENEDAFQNVSEDVLRPQKYIYEFVVFQDVNEDIPHKDVSEDISQKYVPKDMSQEDVCGDHGIGELKFVENYYQGADDSAQISTVEVNEMGFVVIRNGAEQDGEIEISGEPDIRFTPGSLHVLHDAIVLDIQERSEDFSCS